MTVKSPDFKVRIKGFNINTGSFAVFEFIDPHKVKPDVFALRDAVIGQQFQFRRGNSGGNGKFNAVVEPIFGGIQAFFKSSNAFAAGYGSIFNSEINQIVAYARGCFVIDSGNVSFTGFHFERHAVTRDKFAVGGYFKGAAFQAFSGCYDSVVDDFARHSCTGIKAVKNRYCAGGQSRK